MTSYASPARQLSAILIAPDRELARLVSTSASEAMLFQILAELKSYPSPQTLDLRLRQLKPDVVLVDVASDEATGCEVIRLTIQLSPETHVIALHYESKADAVLKSLRAGATEFLHAPFDRATQAEAVARLLRMRAPEPAAEPELGRVVAFSSVKPGAGSSTIATQAAFAIRRATGKNVLLVDFDLAGGVIGFCLKISQPACVLDALAQAEHLDAAAWASLAVNCDGVDVLCAPAAPYTEPVEAARVHALVDYARAVYDWIVIDTPAVFERLSLLTIGRADQTLLVSTAELPSLHLARKAVMTLEQLGFPKERFQMIVNRMNGREGMTVADIEKLLNCKVHATLPSDYFALHRVVTLGQPLDGDGELGRALQALAGSISGQGAVEKRGDAAPANERLAFSVL